MPFHPLLKNENAAEGAIPMQHFLLPSSPLKGFLTLQNHLKVTSFPLQ